MLKFLLVKEVHHIALSYYLDNILGFLSKYFIGIQVKNNLMVTCSLGIDKLNKICNKLFPWIRRSLGLLVSHKDLLLGPSTAVSTGISHASIPSYNGDFCCFLSHESLIAPSSHARRIDIVLKYSRAPAINSQCECTSSHVVG
jgi:hypothetical protein